MLRHQAPRAGPGGGGLHLRRSDPGHGTDDQEGGGPVPEPGMVGHPGHLGIPAIGPAFREG